MLNIKLKARSALNNASLNYDGFSLEEITDVRIMSLAASTAQLQAANALLEQRVGVAWPSVGSSTSGDKVRSLGLQHDQAFLLCERDDSEFDSILNDLASAMAVTDQSDSWVVIRASGLQRLTVLERLSPIDLDVNQFTDNAVARTMMEHLNVIIARDDESFILLSARSSAESFLHALTQSAEFAL